MRFEVPQFIEIEDKIFGPFTWKQFVYLGGGVGLAAVILFTLPLIMFLLVGLPVAGLGAALAFYPVNNQPFSIFLEAIWRFYKTRRYYYWHKKDGTTYKAKVSATSGLGNGVKNGNDDVTQGNIHSLSRQLELNAMKKPEQQQYGQ